MTKPGTMTDWRNVEGGVGRPTRIVKRPKIGQILGGATGPELITRVYRYGERIETEDRHGQRQVISRVPTGWWTVYPTLAASARMRCSRVGLDHAQHWADECPDGAR